MNRESMIERVYAKTSLDFDQIEALTDNQLREMLGHTDAPEKPEKPQRVKPRTSKPQITEFKLVEHNGALYRLETYSDGLIYRVKCGASVKFEGRTVSASIVLHWLRTGDIVKRVPRERKTWQAAIREGATIKHLGRYATREARDAALLAYRLNSQPLAKTIDTVTQ
jgi:hypothetical protein